MVDPKTELYRLRDAFRFRGMDEDEIDELCDLASAEIEDAIVDAVHNAYQEALQAGVDMDAEEFIGEAKPIFTGNSFKIITDSGRTDFSEPPFPMLPKLLKNAKVAKDGSLYKKIPVGKSGGRKKNLEFSVLDVIANINKQRHDLKIKNRQTRDKRGGPKTINDPITAAQTLSSLIEVARKNASGNIDVEKSITVGESTQGLVQIRTASSKQNSSQKWVKPARQLDMTGELMNINSRLEDSISQIVSSTISRYEGMVA